MTTQEWWNGVRIAEAMGRQNQTVRKYRNRTLAKLDPSLTQAEKERVTAADVRAKPSLLREPLGHVDLPLPDAIIMGHPAWKPATIQRWWAQTGRVTADGQVRAPRQMRPPGAGSRSQAA